MTKTRRVVGDPFFWEVIHWLTMTLLGHRIVRGYAFDEDTRANGRLLYIYWDKASNWTDRGDDWHRHDVPFPDPIWRAKP